MNDESKRIRLRREDLRRVPHLSWSAFVEMMTETQDWQRLVPTQRFAWLAFHYDADVTTGGHRKFLERADAARRSATSEALEALDAREQRDVLERACAVLRESGTAEQENERLDELDLAYHAVEPDLQERLERWLAERLPEFVILDDAEQP